MLADNTMRTLLNVAIYMALVAAILPWFLVALPPAAAAFLLVYAVFRHALAPPPLASAGWAEKAGPEIRDHNSVRSYIHTCTRLTALFRDYPGEPVPKM